MIFKNRDHAGKLLGEYLKSLFKETNFKENSLILAIPRGGLPVAWWISKYLNIPFEVLIVKKLAPLAFPEYGFGAMDPDGNYINRYYIYA